MKIELRNEKANGHGGRVGSCSACHRVWRRFGYSYMLIADDGEIAGELCGFCAANRDRDKVVEALGEHLASFAEILLERDIAGAKRVAGWAREAAQLSGWAEMEAADVMWSDVRMVPLGRETVEA